MPSGDGGLGSSLVGEKITMGKRNLNVSKLLGEGGFSYVYLVKEISGDGTPLSSSQHAEPQKGEDPAARRPSGNTKEDGKKVPLVLKITSIHSRAQRDIAEKEAKLLSRLVHPSIVKMYDTAYRTVATATSQGKTKTGSSSTKERPQHLILMEYCEGGHALDVCNKLAASGQKFDLSTLIIAFGQICNAVSYLHAQRPPIVHRDLKPLNFLVKNGAYKLCDFGSAVFGHVDLRSSKARAEADEVIQKTTTQMFRAPEMVDLYMAKKLTQATDVWALGGCLYSLAFLQNCFEEGSNLAILSGKYHIPEDNPYGDGIVELLDRMLTADCKARADMTEVILCLSAVYSGRELPPRKKPSRSSKQENEGSAHATSNGGEEGDGDKVGRFRTDGQGIQQPVYDPTKATEGKKLASNSVAARRKRAAATPASGPAPASEKAADPLDFKSFGEDEKGAAEAFGSDVGFGDMKGFDTKGSGNDKDFFGSFDKGPAQDSPAGFDAAFDTGAWGDTAGAPADATPPAADAPGNPEPAKEAETTPQDPPEGDNTAAPSETPKAEDAKATDAKATEGGDDKKGENPDSQRKERSSRRRRAGGSSRSNRPSGEGGGDSLNVSESSGGEKDRRSRGSRSDRRKGSGRPSRPDHGEDGGPSSADKKASSSKKPSSRG